jgi:hypothetical protein
VRGQQKAPRAAGRVAHRVLRRGLHHLHDRLDELARREVLARALRRLGGALREQAFVDVAFDVRLEREPLLGLDEVHDQALERCRVLDVRARLLEDLAQHAGLAGKVLERLAVLRFQLLTVFVEERGPVVALAAPAWRDQALALARQLRLLVIHLQEQEKGDLFRVGHVRQAVVAQHVREAPRLVDDLLRRVVRHAQAAASG